MSQVVPPTTHGSSMPSMHTVPLGIHGGSGPSTYTTPPVIHGGSFPSAYTTPPTTLGGIGSSTMVPQVPPVMQVHHVPANPTTIANPSHINLPFMECINLLDMAQLTNDLIHHQTF